MKFRYIHICAAVLLSITIQCNGETLPEATPISDPAPNPSAAASADPIAKGPSATPYADAYANSFANPYAYPYAYPYADGNPSLLSSMFERGRDLVDQSMSAGLNIIGVVKDFIPTPHNIFHLGKHLVFELPQEILLYIIQRFCK